MCKITGIYMKTPAWPRLLVPVPRAEHTDSEALTRRTWLLHEMGMEWNNTQLLHEMGTYCNLSSSNLIKLSLSSLKTIPIMFQSNQTSPSLVRAVLSLASIIYEF